MKLQDLLNQIRQRQETFSPAQKLVANYVLEHYHQIPFLSISALAERIGVSNNTIVKFCEQLGFTKFASFKKLIAEYVSEQSDPDLIMTRKLSDSAENLPFTHAMEDDIMSIQTTLNDPHNQNNLPLLLEKMNLAKHIYITGARSSAVMASMFVTQLRYLNYKVHAFDISSGDALDRLSMIEPEDLVIALAFPRYTSQTVKGVQDLHAAGVPVVLITDTGLSPAHPYADLDFHCTVTSGYYFPCLAGCMSLIGAICRAAGASRKQSVSDHIENLESKLLERGMFL